MKARTAASGFAALAQETRLDLMRLLASHGATGLAAGRLAAELAMPPSTLSFHLAALEQAGLIQSTRQGRHIIYAIRVYGLRQLFGFLTETCCGGRPELCGDLMRLLPEETKQEDIMTPAFNVLFLCTRNSARSILAEAIMTKIGAPKFNAYSAGSDPASEPMPEVIERLRVLGHDVSALRSKSWNEFAGPDAPKMDFVITLCDTAIGQVCPEFGERQVSSAWPLPDPAKFTGSDAERTALLNELYGMVRRRIDIFINLPFASLDKMALKKRIDELGDTSRVLG
ncbi:MAG: metalloregulator ArsR/SmtB family transcription factor [Hyphomicrobiaceae bacterium]